MPSPSLGRQEKEMEGAVQWPEGNRMTAVLGEAATACQQHTRPEPVFEELAHCSLLLSVHSRLILFIKINRHNQSVSYFFDHLDGFTSI